MALLIKSGGEQLEVFPQKDGVFTTEEIEGYLGSPLECFGVVGVTSKWIDESGIYRYVFNKIADEPGELPYNTRASALTKVDLAGDVLFTTETEGKKAEEEYSHPQLFEEPENAPESDPWDAY